MAFAPIIVESLLRRPAGQNLISMTNGVTYDFRDDGTGAQVAVVSNEAHASRLLSITEGYRFYGAAGGTLEGAKGLGQAETAFAATAPASTAPIAPPASLDEAVALMLALGAAAPYEAAAAAFPQFFPPPAPVALNVEGNDAAGPAPANAAPPAQPPTTEKADEPAGDLAVSDHADLNGKTITEIRAVFKEELGRNWSPKHKIETLVSQIEGIRAERAKQP